MATAQDMWLRIIFKMITNEAIPHFEEAGDVRRILETEKNNNKK